MTQNVLAGFLFLLILVGIGVAISLIGWAARKRMGP